MSVFLFAGGEDSELTRIGACGVDTGTTSTRRTTYTRCSLKVGPGSPGDAWQAQFAPSSTFWLSARLRITDGLSTTTGTRTLTLLGGVTPRLALVSTYTGGNNLFSTGNWPWVLVKLDAAGASTTLANSGVPYNLTNVLKLDVFVNYAVAGQVQVYVDGTKIIDYSGDVTTNGATSLSAANFGYPANCTNTYWSEMMVATIDTRALTLATLAPSAAGNTYTWTGAVTTINEITLDDTTMATSSTAGQVLETTVTNTTVPSNALAALAVVVNARAQKGNTGGPANLNFMVRTGGTDYSGPNQALPTSFGVVSNAWDTNPATSAAWTIADLTAVGFNIGIKSVT